MSDSAQGNGAPGASQGMTPPEGANGNAGQGGVSAAEVAEIVNKAITARNKAFQKQWEEQASSLTKGMKEQIAEMLAGFKPQEQAGAEAQSGEGKKGKAGKGDGAEVPNTDPRIAELEKQIKAMAQRAEQAEKARLEAESRQREQAIRQATVDALVKGGADPARAKHAIPWLLSEQKLVQYDSEGQMVFGSVDDGTATALEEGVKAWLKTDDGKHYLPPRGVSGSGDRVSGGATPPKGNGQPINRDHIAASLARMAFGESEID